MKSLATLNREYETIIHSKMSKKEKARNCAVLMSYMERYYKVPAIRDPEFEEKNKAVISLYRKLSMSRDI